MTRITQFGIVAGALLSLPLMTTTANAGQETANIDFQANIVAACTLVTPPPALVDFGDIAADDVSFGSTAPFDVTVNCPIEFEIGFNGGLSADINTGPQLLLLNGNDTDPFQLLGYNIFQAGIAVGDTNGVLINNSTNPNSPFVGTADPNNQTIQFNAVTNPVPSAQQTGAYSDRVLMTFAF